MFFKKPERKNLSADFILELKRYIDINLEPEEVFYAADDSPAPEPPKRAGIKRSRERGGHSADYAAGTPMSAPLSPIPRARPAEPDYIGDLDERLKILDEREINTVAKQFANPFRIVGSEKVDCNSRRF